jgi:excisionase family DNA binding protein
MIENMSSTKPPLPKSGRKVQSLEGVILRAFAKPSHGSVTSAAVALRKTATNKIASRISAPAKAKPMPVAATRAEQHALDKMARQARALREQLAKAGLVQVETVRMRPQGSLDRRFVVELAPDPEDSRSVLLRVRPATDAPLPAVVAAMLTTQEAADRLNVSRPYVVQLVDEGRFKNVQRTQAGHRRIPLAEVERMGHGVRVVHRVSLDNIAKTTRKLRERELIAAKARSKRRWVAKTA